MKKTYYLDSDIFKHDYNYNELSAIDWDREFNTRINIKYNLNGVLPQKLNKLLVNETPFICLHIRTSEFHNDAGIYGSDIRNANHLNYVLTIKHLITSGFYVVLVGSPSSYYNELEEIVQDERLINYPSMDCKILANDIVLISKCYLYIGCNSGLVCLAELFQVPILNVNIPDFFFGPLKKVDIAIYKHVYSKKENRALTLEETFKLGTHVNGYYFPNSCEKLYSFIDNTEEEILNATKIILSNLTNKSLYNYMGSEKINKLQKNSIKLWLDDKKFSEKLKDKHILLVRSYWSGKIVCTHTATKKEGSYDSIHP
jgi:putative glycosyltransferase (TIGR04372 family)